ncbi:uncharacterized protein LOC128272519 isoform X2 [Anopheles cruzii]|uniref:uncharacterized protein LOC128272519 isoform X2 n=1 Tax=Anopheles cruzii TaxID=68878 RepID=UPI0022EC8455|nr:uncharacterized protein LOC128272519 isoform X2 [Anopheles cruzii]
MDKPSRPVRNRKRSRKAWSPGDTHRPVKRLFTPEIKRLLKDWLVRRRENPYPNREEKKLLAVETGLTYTQICNWFANWRRKLKNSGNDPVRKTWGNLIRHYNTNARGNVEQFSICSSDSIWSAGEGDDSQDSFRNSPPPEHHVLAAGGGRHHETAGSAMAYVKFATSHGRSKYDGFVHGHPTVNNNISSCRNNNSNSNSNGRKYADYLRHPEMGGGERAEENPPYDGMLRDSYPATTFCFDHCYTPRNYETVFGIPEDTRCYKVKQIADKYGQESSVRLEPLILATGATAFGAYDHVHDAGGSATLFLAPPASLSPPMTPPPVISSALPNGQIRSSKYKSSIMEKYLRDLGELEPAHSKPPNATDGSGLSVIMATIPFQRGFHHHHHHHHLHRHHHHPAADEHFPQSTTSPGLLSADGRLGCDTNEIRGPPPSLSKWLESTAKFTPSKHNYIGDWDKSGWRNESTYSQQTASNQNAL